MKKITRRVALGTIVGGMIAAPFVVRSLRNRTNDDILADSEFKKSWKRALERFNMEVRPIDGPESFPIGYRLQDGLQFKFASLSVNHIEGRLVEEQSVDVLPQWFCEVTNHITTRVVDGRTRMESSVQENALFKPGNGTNDTSAGSFTLELDAARSNVAAVALDGKNFIPMPIFDLPYPCSVTVTAMFGQYPKESVCRLDNHWETASVQNGFEYPLMCRVVGFANVKGRKCFELDLSWQTDTFTKSPMIDLLPKSDKKFAAIRKMYETIEFRHFHKGVRYVDIETGLVLYETAYIHSDTRLIGTTKNSSIDAYSAGYVEFV